MAKILVVEDDPQILKVISDCLKIDHHTVEAEEDGSIALEKLKLFQYDVLIFDWNLPNVSGVELCKEYRNRGGQRRHLDVDSEHYTLKQRRRVGFGS